MISSFPGDVFLTSCDNYITLHCECQEKSDKNITFRAVHKKKDGFLCIVTYLSQQPVICRTVRKSLHFSV